MSILSKFKQSLKIKEILVIVDSTGAWNTLMKGSGDQKHAQVLGKLLRHQGRDSFSKKFVLNITTVHNQIQLRTLLKHAIPHQLKPWDLFSIYDADKVL